MYDPSSRCLTIECEAFVCPELAVGSENVPVSLRVNGKTQKFVREDGSIVIPLVSGNNRIEVLF